MRQFIETQFPIARLSAESYKERKANNGQTLTRLGKWWGRKPLILVRASILGMLMPASDDPKKDREIFLKILTMDDDGAWQRCTGDIPVVEWRRFAPPEVQEDHFTARGFQRGLSDEEKADICNEIWESLNDVQKAELDATRRRPISDRVEFDALPYAERIRHCLRPEQIAGPSSSAWREINAHLGTTATNLSELDWGTWRKAFRSCPPRGRRLLWRRFYPLRSREDWLRGFRFRFESSRRIADLGQPEPARRRAKKFRKMSHAFRPRLLLKLIGKSQSGESSTTNKASGRTHICIVSKSSRKGATITFLWPLVGSLVKDQRSPVNGKKSRARTACSQRLLLFRQMN